MPPTAASAACIQCRCLAEMPLPDRIRVHGYRKGAALLGAACLALAISQPAAAEDQGDTISGRAVVIDADVLRIGEQRIILWGVDAPEPPQVCAQEGAAWDCHGAALRLTETIVGRGEVTCVLEGDPDPLGRRYGVCLSGKEDLGEVLVRSGLALAYSEQTDAYEAAQLDAISTGKGLWAPGVTFREPWIWREESEPGGLR